ncbi:MAG: MFS transporter [Phenylobacterium sp.]|uniref:MFS transporter n=1 Tax=Phenylobacterium sp. TaxID=1871053 RepID=UPI0025DD7985|nr:MFS transporter [Phenylobacterium sp.]MBA4011678.1 MFS transporter [Phenylobacterium sp.]
MTAALSVAGAPAASRRDVTIALTIGVVALLIAGLQPVVLGGLESEGRLTASQIGLAATVELLALGLTCGLAAAFLKPDRVRLKLALACVAHAGAMFGTCFVTGAGVIAMRGAAGVFAGLMLWAAISTITRAQRPEHLSGVFVTVQTLAQLVLAAALPATVVPWLGINGALEALGVISLLTAIAALAGADSYSPLPKAEKGSGGIGLRPLLGLAACFLFMAFIVALWVYLEPLAELSGMSAQQAGLAVAVALGMQVAGGAAATLAARRWQRPGIVLLAVGALNGGILAILFGAPQAALFMGAVAVFGFLWLFALPFQTLLLIQLDPTRRAAMQLGTAQLLGSSFGPLVASFVVSNDEVRGAIGLSAVLLVLALAAIALLTASRPASAAGDSTG